MPDSFSAKEIELKATPQLLIYSIWEVIRAVLPCWQAMPFTCNRRGNEMSFVGDLEHLPIVDVIQLLNSTRKSGTLCVKSGKHQSQLVFMDGYIAGANHANNSVRIGKILVDMNAITSDVLETTLAEQKRAGTNRLPLIASLIESGEIEKEVAYKGLETLIEMTIVEILTWSTGTFELDIDKIVISDEYRYFPEKLKENIYLNTQSVLMDALRIYDEKMRDGELTGGVFTAGETAEEFAFEDPPTSSITPDLLGLDELEQMERTIPDVFLAAKDPDSVESSRRKLRSELTDTLLNEQQKLLSYLKNTLSVAEPPAFGSFKKCMKELGTLVEARDISFALLRFAAGEFERAITFVVGDSELIAERGIGMNAGETSTMRFRTPLVKPSLFQKIIDERQVYFGETSDDTSISHLHREIGAPNSSLIALVPISRMNRVIAVIYCDFGSNAAAAAQIDLLEILCRHAALLLENAIYRKKLEKAAQSA